MAGLVAGVLSVGLAGCTSSTETAAADRIELRFSWWGNADRAATTQRVIARFQEKYPNIAVKGEPTDFNAYFDRLINQVAANNAPDIITLGGAYVREYADRGVLLDLAKVGEALKTDKIDALALGDSQLRGRQYGVPTGVNTFAVVADPVVFERAGVSLPDDDSWSWSDFVRIATEIAEKSPEGTYGVADFTKTDTIDLYARQRGESLYTADGRVGVSERTLRDLWTMTTALRDAGATPAASVTSDLSRQSAPEQSLIGRGLAGMQFEWSNQLTALRKSSDHELILLRVPGESQGTQRGMWLQASQSYSINVKTPNPREAARFVDFLINSEEAGKLILTDRGISANSRVRAAMLPALSPEQTAQVKFIDRTTRQVGPPLIIGPTGSTAVKDALLRINDDVLYGRITPADAASEFIRVVKAAIER